MRNPHDMDKPGPAPSHWMQDALTTTARNALNGIVAGAIREVDGRWVEVLASPEMENSQHLAMGLSVLPEHYATTPHSHEAEEVAIVLEGAGRIEIGNHIIDVARGSIVVTPPHAPHRTIADQPLTILWLYAPAGSEMRWITDDA